MQPFWVTLFGIFDSVCNVRHKWLRMLITAWETAHSVIAALLVHFPQRMAAPNAIVITRSIIMLAAALTRMVVFAIFARTGAPTLLASSSKLLWHYFGCKQKTVLGIHRRKTKEWFDGKRTEWGTKINT